MPAPLYMHSPRTRTRIDGGWEGESVRVSDGGPHRARAVLHGPDADHRARVEVARGPDLETWTVYRPPGPERGRYHAKYERTSTADPCRFCARTDKRTRPPLVTVTTSAGVFRCACGATHTSAHIIRQCGECGECDAKTQGGSQSRAALYRSPPERHSDDSDSDEVLRSGRSGDRREWLRVARRDCCGYYEARWGLPNAPEHVGRYRADRHGVFPAAYRRRAAAALAALGRRAERATAYAF